MVEEKTETKEMKVNESKEVKHHTSRKYPRMAGFKDRFVAIFIDGLILSAINGVLFSIFSPLYFHNIALSMNYNNAQAASSTFGFAQTFFGLFSIALGLGYFGYFYTTRGQTIGKQVMKLKVVRSADLKYLSWGEAILREVIRSFISSFLFFLGYLWYFMSEKRQTWHDIIASTYVVKTDDKGEILMDGLASYKKEPVKTFGCCGAIGVAAILIFAAVMFAIVTFINAVKDEVINNRQPNMQQDYEMNFDDDYQYYNDEDMAPGDDVTEEELKQYFEQNFPGALDQLDQQNMQSEPEATPQQL